MRSEADMERLRLARIPKPKKVPKPIARKSKKKLQQEADERALRAGDDSEELKFYKSQQKFLTGRCIRCGYKYDHRVFENAVKAMAHVLPKRDSMFPSVKTHPYIIIELPPWCGCHNWYDNKASWEEIALDKIWPVVLSKFIMIEPCIAPEERSRLPEVLLQEIKPAL